MKKKVGNLLIAALLCAVVTLCHLAARLIIKLQQIDSTGAMYIEAVFLIVPDVCFLI